MLPLAAGKWVGIVDDDESVRRSLERFFLIVGIDVRTFASAHEFLSYAGAPPSCLIIDVQLGTSTGFELRDRLATRSLPLPPIIFITARDDIAPSRLGDETGGCTWLAKPFRAETLLALVQDMQARRDDCSVAVGARSSA